MSKSNIYETTWTDLVFENKNKEYGAYQLRQENSKTTITALFAGLLLLASIGTGSMLINKFRGGTVVDTPTIPDTPTHTTKVDIHDNVVKPEAPKPVAPPKQTVPTPEVVQLTHPVVAAPTEVIPEIATNKQNGPAVDNAAPGNGTPSDNALPGGNGPETVVTPSVSPEVPVIAAALDKLPEFPGGINKFYTFVGNNFNRPELDAEKTLKVYVSFVIERDGSMTDIEVKRDPGYGMGREAIRVLKSLKTKWSPGMLNGKAVRTAYNLPITIKTELE
ncbi:outer membrane transport energization protein TonB [Flavobacterium sp. 90]|uniref:energy transducer TonB n=1 Tax=unclassified Flavobacterium TaxID=196869 RepID=UPI000EABD148|nr:MULTISPECIES: energy transducer TonB [unclassified Flavobacterium]RKR11029.1 outer membrane transport energization protein TonB [Flavobacterium sp. 81]TCK54812.1 outer membrane transport energization protein TonB [Flavobacterium sp. 90]